MNWRLSYRADPAARVLADRHYNRQSIGADQFVPPGRCVVLVIPGAAFWVTSWPFAEYVKHAWAGAWVCSAFRNERPDLHLSSSLIREAIAATRFYWDPPPLGMITFVDRDKTRHKRDPGRCYRKAGFREPSVCSHPDCGRERFGGFAGLGDHYCPTETAGGLVTLQMLPEDMPEASAPIGQTLELIA